MFNPGVIELQNLLVMDLFQCTAGVFEWVCVSICMRTCMCPFGLFMQARVCIMCVLCTVICVYTAGPGDAGATVWSVGREREG